MALLRCCFGAFHGFRSDSGGNSSAFPSSFPRETRKKRFRFCLPICCAQSFPPHEIIVVDDDSRTRRSKSRARSACTYSHHDKPAGWVGKSWACQKRRGCRTGDVLVFLDADVRLARTD